MFISMFFKKATTFLGLSTPEKLKPPPLDGEIIYCKNNVCVHPPAPLVVDPEHFPGYLTIRSHQNENETPILVLTWIPNTSLRRNPRSIENSPNASTVPSPKVSPRRSRQEFAKSDEMPVMSSPSFSPRESTTVSSCGEHITNLATQLSDTTTDTGRDDISSESSQSSTSAACSMKDDNSLESFGPGEESQKDKMSNSYKSQCDSGIGPDEMSQLILQNNEKLTDCAAYPKLPGLGSNVNNLHYSKNTNRKKDPDRVFDPMCEPISSPESDGLTPEQQLAALLNRNKLEDKVHGRERSGSTRSVSIEMDGDKLVIVTEECDDDVILPDVNSCVSNVNINQDNGDVQSNNIMTIMRDDSSSLQSTDQDCRSISSDSSNLSPTVEHYREMLTDLTSKLDCPHHNPMCNSMLALPNNAGAGPSGGTTPLLESGSSYTSSKTASNSNLSLDLKETNTPGYQNSNISTPTPDITMTRYRFSSSSSTTTSGPDSHPPTPYSSSPENSPVHFSSEAPNSPSASSCSSMCHDLVFPENSVAYTNDKKSKITPKEQMCGVFSVNLAQMRSLRLFYSDQQCTRGQVVIASRQSQYKILHFHTGGLDKLAQIFEDWNIFAQANKRDDSPYRQFLIVWPQITDDQCHPEESLFGMVTEDMWKKHMTDSGQVEEVQQLRKAIFFGGLQPAIRHEAWPFLLQYYPFESTYEEREQMRNDRYLEYQELRKRREAMTDDERADFWRSIQCTVEKDVVRTDRTHPYFKGENNPNIQVLQNILLNYAVANPHLGYTQGMSDLLSPVLAEIRQENDTYWCFVGLMQRTIFVSAPKDCDMDRQLLYLRGLLKLMEPKFYQHLKKLGQDAMELLFCHRWILLCFKREFPEVDALKMWEACWAHYQTDYFHLFVCLAIIAIYGDDIVEQNLPADEMLLHFSSLAMHMNGELVLRKARGMLYDFRSKLRIPCTLHGLCMQCGPGMWDSGHVPAVECIGHKDTEQCLYNSNPSTPVKCSG